MAEASNLHARAHRILHTQLRLTSKSLAITIRVPQAVLTYFTRFGPLNTIHNPIPTYMSIPNNSFDGPRQYIRWNIFQFLVKILKEVNREFKCLLALVFGTLLVPQRTVCSQLAGHPEIKF